MTHITKLVDRGLEVRANIEKLKEELECIEQELQIIARNGEQIDLVDPDREGRQYLAQGSELTVPVVLTADIIASTFTDGSAVHQKIEAASGGKLTEFYRATTTWKLLAKSGKAFRAQAAHILGSAAPALVTAALSRDRHGLPKSNIKVEWDRATEN
jgi:hypothetical protein